MGRRSLVGFRAEPHDRQVMKNVKSWETLSVILIHYTACQGGEQRLAEEDQWVGGTLEYLARFVLSLYSVAVHVSSVNNSPSSS